MSKRVVRVAVGVVVNAESQQVFLTRRHQDAHQGGKWEFPGGKVESEETVAEALFRELKEEIAIEVLACQSLMTIEHDYGDKQVCLEVYLVDNYSGQPQPQEGQDSDWFSISELAEIDFPEANVAIVEQLHQHYLA